MDTKFSNDIVQKNFEFRQYLDEVHKPDRRDWNVKPSNNEVMVEEGWRIVIKNNSSRVIQNVAKDLQDYLNASMNVAALLDKRDDLHSALKEDNVILLATKEDLA